MRAQRCWLVAVRENYFPMLFVLESFKGQYQNTDSSSYGCLALGLKIPVM